MGHFHLEGFIKPCIWTSVITHKQKHFIPTKNNLLGPYHRRKRKDSGYAANQLEDCRWRKTFQCVTHNNSVVEISPTRNWDHLEPSTFGATSRNHAVIELTYSPQHLWDQNCGRAPGRHNPRISTQTSCNHLRRFTLCVRRPYRGPTLNR